LIQVKLYAPNKASAWVRAETMNESEVRIEDLKAEIRESLDRIKAMVDDSGRFVRDHTQLPPEARAEAE
jgi:hypothetical protein